MDGMMMSRNMSMKGNKGKKGLITKTWERCKSFGRGRKGPSPSKSITGGHGSAPVTTRSRSWPSRDYHDIGQQDQEKNKGKKGRVAPEGCFSVYVGPQMQRFVIKTEYANHPLFKMLLEEAESEYGYSSQGPLALPCHVDIFYKVLMEMDQEGNYCDEQARQGCGFVKRTKSYQLLSPSRMAAINNF